MAIDVGAACINRSAITVNGVRTYVGKENPANDTGTIDAVCIYAPSYAPAPEGVEVASFSAAGNDLTTNDSVSLGNLGLNENTFAAPGDFTAFNINSGEYIGISYDSGRIERTDSGSGYWYSVSDQIPCTSQTFTSGDSRTISLYCTGTESTGGWTGIICGVTNPAKINGIAVADIAKVCGIS